ncbi:MAG: SDR family NAD(P)-dependent oxidoreductase [Turicibacter sp.]|nr:SDR family NAD(P)-dependent oxidoreductase [Turicibacter sp.]
MDYQDKVVVITGGANGIGRALVSAFAKAGAKVATIDIEAGEYLGNFPGNVLFLQGDIPPPIDGGMSRLMIYDGDRGWSYSRKEH